jgi:hypothetical protein
MEATVTSCVKAKEVNGKPVYKITLSDGRSGESFAKEIPIGTKEADLAIEESQYGLKIKMKGGGFGGGAVKQRAGNESFALSYAKDLVVADKVKIDQIIPTAEKLYQWLESKKK